MDTDTTTSHEVLRAEMVAKVRKMGYAQRSELDTPRHEFVPDADLIASPNTPTSPTTQPNHRPGDPAARCVPFTGCRVGEVQAPSR